MPDTQEPINICGSVPSIIPAETSTNSDPHCWNSLQCLLCHSFPFILQWVPYTLAFKFRTSKMQTCVPSMSGMSAVAACPQSSIGNDPLALPSPTSLPPPVSNSSCLFTQCHPLYASYCTGVLYWSFSFNISPSNEYSGLSSFRMDWLDLLAVQGTLKCLLQHHSSKVSILRCSAFFIVQLSHPYMTTGKTMALTRWAFFQKVCLCFLICCLGLS